MRSTEHWGDPDPDPKLDDDLLAWHDPDSRVAKLTLFGPAKLMTATPAPPLARLVTELVTYLFAHPLGVSPNQLNADWHGGDEADVGNHAMIVAASRWLGRDPRTDAPCLIVEDRDLSFSGWFQLQGVLVDGDLFWRLRVRGLRLGTYGISDLWAALELVRGEPLLELQAKRAAWLDGAPLHHEYTAAIVDVAHRVATHHLAAGEYDLAERAARVALLAGATDDQPLMDLWRVCDATGRATEADSYARQILSNKDLV